MDLLTKENSVVLWHDVIKSAEKRCSIHLNDELESYLISLLIRYTDKPEMAKQILATAFIEAMQQREVYRNFSLQVVGDQCLLFAGLFPRAAERKHVKISYFVNLGRSAYLSVSEKTNDVYRSLGMRFVMLMDILQSIPASSDLLPLQAFEQWDELGSKNALRILKTYTNAYPFKNKY